MEYRADLGRAAAAPEVSHPGQAAAVKAWVAVGPPALAVTDWVGVGILGLGWAQVAADWAFLSESCRNLKRKLPAAGAAAQP